MNDEGRPGTTASGTSTRAQAPKRRAGAPQATRWTLLLLAMLWGCGEPSAPSAPTLTSTTRTSPTPSAPKTGRVVVDGTQGTLADDDYVLNSAEITGDTLTASVSYSGGCRAHVFTVVVGASFVDSSPVSLRADLRHDGNGDSCEAFPTESYAFDLAVIKTRYRDAYGPGTGRVALEVADLPGDPLIYDFTN